MSGTRTRSGGALGRGLGTRSLLGRMFGRGNRPPATHAEATSIAIASGKGGTGKSFFSTNLAVTLHQQLKRVTLTDCDFGLACGHLLLGVNPEHTLQHYLSGQARLQDLRIATPAGPSLVPGASGIIQMADLTDRQLLMLSQLFAEIVATEDVMLMDVGAGISPQNILTLLAADHVILITQAELAALTDAYAVVKCCARLRPDVRISVVVNRVGAPGQGQPTFDKLSKVASQYTSTDLHFLGEIPEDPTVTQRRLGQQPLAISNPEGPVAQAIQAITERLNEVIQPLGRRQVDSETCIKARFQKHRLFLS